MATTRVVQWVAVVTLAGVWSMGDAPTWLRVAAGLALALVAGAMIAADATAYAKAGA